MKEKTLWICHTAIGTALFIALAMCIRVPVFENYYLCLGYVALVVYAGTFGSLSGALIGSLGVMLYCLVTNGLRGMPGWAAGNIFIGAALGWSIRQMIGRSVSRQTISTDVFRQTIGRGISSFRILMLAVQIALACAVGILGIKSVVECLLYAQPFLVRVAKNSYAFVADTIVMWIGVPVYLMVRRATGNVREIPKK